MEDDEIYRYYFISLSISQHHGLSTCIVSDFEDLNRKMNGKSSSCVFTILCLAHGSIGEIPHLLLRLFVCVTYSCVTWYSRLWYYWGAALIGLHKISKQKKKQILPSPWRRFSTSALFLFCIHFAMLEHSLAYSLYIYRRWSVSIALWAHTNTNTY